MDRTNMYSLVLLVYHSDTRCYHGENWVKGTWDFSVHFFCNLLCAYSYFKKKKKLKNNLSVFIVCRKDL